MANICLADGENTTSGVLRQERTCGRRVERGLHWKFPLVKRRLNFPLVSVSSQQQLWGEVLRRGQVERGQRDIQTRQPRTNSISTSVSPDEPTTHQFTSMPQIWAGLFHVVVFGSLTLNCQSTTTATITTETVKLSIHFISKPRVRVTGSWDVKNLTQGHSALKWPKEASHPALERFRKFKWTHVKLLLWTHRKALSRINQEKEPIMRQAGLVLAGRNGEGQTSYCGPAPFWLANACSTGC